MAAGQRQDESGTAKAVRSKKAAAKKDETEAASTLPEPVQKKWVERPIEPIVTSGIGMHVLGFVPSLAKLALKPLAKPEPPVKTPEAEAATAAEEEHRVRGPTSWKKGRPLFTHGNYSAYYNYRNKDGARGAQDPRLLALEEQFGPRFFHKKEVLDIGCNNGTVALAVGRHFRARRVVGCDIDANLIEAANANQNRELDETVGGSKGSNAKIEFRAESILTAPLRRPPDMLPERFDVVMCLSVTKWVHFAEGDSGIRRLFKRVWKRLRPGGVFVLEPQDWNSYKKKRHITREIRQTVAGIELRPEAFPEHLQSLGFELLGSMEPPEEATPLFRRKIWLFKRPEEEAEEEAQEVEEEQVPKQKKARAHEEIEERAPKRRRAEVAEEEADEPLAKAKDTQEHPPGRRKTQKAVVDEGEEEEEEVDTAVDRKAKGKTQRSD